MWLRRMELEGLGEIDGLGAHRTDNVVYRSIGEGLEVMIGTAMEY